MLSDDHLRLRFVREAEALAKRQHPHIIPVFEADEIEGLCYLAIAFCDGPTLDQWLQLQKERLDPQAVMESIAASGRPAFYEPDAAHIIEKLVPLLKEKDVVAIFSNGGFEGIHGKLLAALDAAKIPYSRDDLVAGGYYIVAQNPG